MTQEELSGIYRLVKVHCLYSRLRWQLPEFGEYVKWILFQDAVGVIQWNYVI
mgnify:CR=1 FL=1